MQVAFEEDSLVIISGTNIVPDNLNRMMLSNLSEDDLLGRLKKGLLTVVQIERPGFDELLELHRLAKENFVPFYVIGKVNRNMPDKVVNYKTRKRLRRLGLLNFYLTEKEREWKKLLIKIKKINSRKWDEHGPLDFIGDVHGCYEELILLLKQLQYNIEEVMDKNDMCFRVWHPKGRKLVFLGDMVDRGPASDKVLRLLVDMDKQHLIYAVPGNHDEKFVRYLKGNHVRINNGLEETVKQFKNASAKFKREIIRFYEKLPSHYMFDSGKVVAVHAGIREDMQGKEQKEVRDYCVFGEPSGEYHDDGLPIRLDWGKHYEGSAKVVYGHTPVKEPSWINNSLDIDSGCVFGGKLTALRYPEMETISVDALGEYYQGGEFIDFKEEWNLPD